jgi:ParB family chromosome partitioning protein
MLTGMQLDDAKRAQRTRLSSRPKETKATPKIGRPRNPVIAKIMQERDCSRAEAYRVLAERKLRHRTQRERLLAETFQFSSLIKPSDNWNVGAHYPRIDDGTGYGYIPGDLYAQCLFYFATHGDLVIAPMAGSGQIRRVYEDRALWTKGLPQPWDLDLRMFDLTPRGPYQAQIGRHDLCTGFPPCDKAPDYVILDPPYLGICRGQYGRRPDDLANMDEAAWTDAIAAIARGCAKVRAKRCTVIVPATWVDIMATPWRQVLCGEIVRAAWRGAGYRLACPCYASRHIQQHDKHKMMRWNALAKANRVPLSDIAEVLTFDLG